MINKKRITTISLAVVLFSVVGAVRAAEGTNDVAIDLGKTEDLFAQPVKPNPLTSDPSAVAVRVNGREITRGEIMEALNVAMRQLAGRIPPQQLQAAQANLFQTIKDRLVSKALLEQAATAAKIEVSDEEVSTALSKIKEQIPPGKTLEEILKSEGSSLEEFTSDLKKSLAIDKLMDEQIKEVPAATEEEAKAFYDAHPDDFKKPETVTVSHILIKVDPDASEEVKAEKKTQIEQIRSDILAGKISFEDAATKYSDCPSKAQGGSLGTIPKGKMVPEFELAAFTQETNEIGDVIETQYGYHVIKVSAHEDASVVSFEETKERIVEYLTDTKKREVASNYVKGLREEAKIEDLTPPRPISVSTPPVSVKSEE